ncbi:hypothetical protein N8H72_03425 [Pseudomonas koreensis]|uniref:DUF6680 family protein n=1 Tax=Pseudomonas koreensis TaxID=198620 RepID=UPI0021C7BC6C|nr:DUF6680 family protein [Pseudomonas koreensis]MCU0088999.1 hypothetical protein [Pseudomonas koreensis]
MDASWFFGIGTIVATFLGPILAVQIQKYLERTGEARSQKMWIFSTLMATRGATLAADHVRALNMIDLAFNGGRLRQRGKLETDVLDAWREYLDHLNTQYNESTFARWIEKKQELLVLLLSAMAADLDLRYDRVLLRNGAYMPKGHTDLENDQYVLRQLALKVLSGEQPLTMNVADFPFSADLAESQQRLQDALATSLSEHGYVNVRVIPDR